MFTHAYADDTQLYISFKPDGSAAETDAVDALQAYIRDIRTWMVQDKLQRNDAKTEFLIIGTRAQLNKVTINDLQAHEVKVSAVYSVRNLGAWFDANMNMTTHINRICQSIFYHLRNIRRIRKYYRHMIIGSPLYLTIRLRARVFYEQIVNEAQPS